MPIDLMSPLQAIENATMKLAAMNESEKHLKIAQQNADSKRMTAEAYSKYVQVQDDKNKLKQQENDNNLAISNNDLVISNNALATEKERTKQSKELTKQEIEKTNQSKELTKRNKNRNKKKPNFKQEPEKSKNVADYAESQLNDNVEGILASQPRLGGDE